jgi:hypothetical protein
MGRNAKPMTSNSLDQVGFNWQGGHQAHLRGIGRRSVMEEWKSSMTKFHDHITV